jgi:hypothetical protein
MTRLAPARKVGHQGHQRLVAGLRVGGLGRRHGATGAERKPEVAGDLPGAQQTDRRLRRAEAGAGLHVDVGQNEPKITGPGDQLGQRDAGQRLGDLLDRAAGSSPATSRPSG